MLMTMCSQDCWLLHWNIKISTGYDIWESLFSESIIFKWDCHQGMDAKHFHSPCVHAQCILWPRSHQHWSKWGPWALFEIHNMDEALHIARDWRLSSKSPHASQLVYAYFKWQRWNLGSWDILTATQSTVWSKIGQLKRDLLRYSH